MSEFSFIIGVGASLGLLRIVQFSTSSQIGYRIQNGLLAIIGCLLGARVGFVIFHIHFYRSHLQQILALQEGGYALSGAVVGWLISLCLLSYFRKEPLLQMVDHLAPMLLPLTIAGWAGCWFEGCAYGKIATDSWWGVPCRDASNLFQKRFPLQPVAAISLLLFFLLIELREKSRAYHAPGKYGLLAILVTSINLFLFSILQDSPESQMGGRLSIDSWIAFFTSILSLLGLIYALNWEAGRKKTR